MIIVTRTTCTWEFIQTDNVVHETGGDDNFVKHGYTAPNQPGVATLRTHCQILSIAVLKDCWHLLCSLRFQHNLACTWKWSYIKSCVPGQWDSHHKMMGYGKCQPFSAFIWEFIHAHWSSQRRKLENSKNVRPCSQGDLYTFLCGCFKNTHLA
jgi:hypothetical protein